MSTVIMPTTLLHRTPTSSSTSGTTLSQQPDLFRNPRAVDDILSQELSLLSFADRNAINEEIHGVQCLAPDETPDLQQDALTKLMKELSFIPRKDAYDQACFLYPKSYIHSNEFRLRFLRYELMDPHVAAKRIVTFLDGAVELFGTQILERPLKMCDLGKDGMEMMRTGHYQCLPFRDRSGRRILAFVGNFGLQYPIVVRVRSETPFVHVLFVNILQISFILLFLWSTR
jgi:hypothetical protein